jgi:cytochrome c biogenesis protein
MTRMLHVLASLRLTLGGLLLLAAGLVVDQNQWLPGVWAITPPLALLAVNLAVALMVDSRFRRKPALFAFHLCLLLIAVLAGYGQIVRYDARLPLTEGQAFAAALLQPVRSGLLLPDPLADGVLKQGAIEVDYTPGIRRGATRSQVWLADRGWLEIGDDVPLLIDGYRLYTTSNKGFAALLTWLPDQGDQQLGAVQFPSYPAKELGQVSRWHTPAGQQIGLALALPPSPYNETWTLSAGLADGAAIELNVAGQRQVLHPGDVITVRGGRLRYERLSMWMGYELTYDPTLPWLFSIAVLAVIFMAIHFAARILRPVRTGAVDSTGYPA